MHFLKIEVKMSPLSSNEVDVDNQTIQHFCKCQSFHFFMLVERKFACRFHVVDIVTVDEKILGTARCFWDVATDFKRRAFEVIGPEKALLADSKIPADTKMHVLADAAVSDRVHPRP